MFYIKVFPKDPKFLPHFWKEGGFFYNEKTARSYNLQLYKMYIGKKKLYSRVEVFPVDDNIREENIQVEFEFNGGVLRGIVTGSLSSSTLKVLVEERTKVIPYKELKFI